MIEKESCASQVSGPPPLARVSPMCAPYLNVIPEKGPVSASVQLL